MGFLSPCIVLADGYYRYEYFRGAVSDGRIVHEVIAQNLDEADCEMRRLGYETIDMGIAISHRRPGEGQRIPAA